MMTTKLCRVRMIRTIMMMLMVMMLLMMMALGFRVHIVLKVQHHQHAPGPCTINPKRRIIINLIIILVVIANPEP